MSLVLFHNENSIFSKLINQSINQSRSSCRNRKTMSQKNLQHDRSLFHFVYGFVDLRERGNQTIITIMCSNELHLDRDEKCDSEKSCGDSFYHTKRNVIVLADRLDSKTVRITTFYCRYRKRTQYRHHSLETDKWFATRRRMNFQEKVPSCWTSLFHFNESK